MLTVRVSCLPNMEEDELRLLHKSIVDSVRSIKELDIGDESEMLTLFSKDMMQFGLGTTILVEIIGLSRNPSHYERRDLLAENVGKVVSSKFATAQVICMVSSFTYEQGGYWKNR